MDRENTNHGSQRRGVALTAAAIMLGISGGCAREDADCLARIGRKSLARAETLTGDANDRLAAGWQALRAEKDVAPSDRIAVRLRWDKELTGVEITVHAVEGALELRGKVRSAEQRQRAMELAQATTGVETVRDALEMIEAEP